MLFAFGGKKSEYQRQNTAQKHGKFIGECSVEEKKKGMSYPKEKLNKAQEDTWPVHTALELFSAGSWPQEYGIESSVLTVSCFTLGSSYTIHLSGQWKGEKSFKVKYCFALLCFGVLRHFIIRGGL